MHSMYIIFITCICMYYYSLLCWNHSKDHRQGTSQLLQKSLEYVSKHFNVLSDKLIIPWYRIDSVLVFASLLLILLEANSNLIFLAAARPFKLFRCVRKCVCMCVCVCECVPVYMHALCLPDYHPLAYNVFILTFCRGCWGWTTDTMTFYGH